ncbi:response regulator transcription factor [Burkholderia pyrrocinia]|uniref:response regulator transcription factor n=1 Tax=Burkholderia pyrrocinia TaxID=60550 RepID=UPI001589BAB0|nr:response regulator transcription factor [Burkholderia pyrrocinia]
MKIAILERDPVARDSTLAVLSSAGHCCSGVPDDETLKSLLKTVFIELIVLDWAAPDPVRLETLRWLHHYWPAIRVVLGVTRHTSEADLVLGLQAGADIYVEKPFDNSGKLARINALGRHLRPSSSVDSGRFVTDDLCFDTSSGHVEMRGQRIALMPKEFSLALLLFRNMSQTLSRYQIAVAVWGDEVVAHSRTIDTHISSIRIKLGLRLENGYRLSAVCGDGYRLNRCGGYRP